jgi:hypothetical protein
MKCNWCYVKVKYKTQFCCKECESYYRKLYNLYTQVDELESPSY